MAAPLKPWERIGVNSNTQPIISDLFANNPSQCLMPQDRLQGGSSSAARMSGTSAPPPLPPRANAANPSTSRYGGGLGGYNSSYSGYSPLSSMYGPQYGGYSSYGGMGGYGYNRFGGGGGYGGDPYNPENNFWQSAEESSRNAFQSIESIVQAFGSVSMMLESTFHAVYSSFRAVVGVADHFSRLRSHMTQMVSALAIIRTLRWMYRRLLQILGLRNVTDPNVDEAWSTAQQDIEVITALTESDLKRSRSSWPIIIFFSVVFGTPWLIWRILQSVTCKDTKSTRNWMTGEGDHFVAFASYDFATDNEREVPFRVGQELKLAPKELQPRVRGWLLATVDGKKAGLVPANYLKIQGKRHGTCNIQVVQPIPASTNSTMGLPASTAEHTNAECDLADAFQESTNDPSQV